MIMMIFGYFVYSVKILAVVLMFSLALRAAINKNYEAMVAWFCAAMANLTLVITHPWPNH